MNEWAVRALRAILVISLAGSLVVQVVFGALPWADDGKPTGAAFAVAIIGVLGIATLQVTAVCIWILLTKVRRGTVFSTGALRYVDIVIGAVGCASILVFALAVVARFANHATPGDEIAPGLVAFVCGLSLVVAGVALVIYVMRSLLAQAVARDAQAQDLQAELDDVI